MCQHLEPETHKTSVSTVICLDHLCCRMSLSCIVTKYVAFDSKVDMVSSKEQVLAGPTAIKQRGL